MAGSVCFHTSSLLCLDSPFAGPISLLVTTMTEPSSPDHEALLNKLIGLNRRNSELNSTLSVHILHLDAKTEENPNAYLNLARMFSQTHRVVLIPGPLSSTPPKTLYRALLPQTLASAAISVSSSSKYRPVVLTARSQTAFPFSPLSPVLLDRDHPVWCTERFFPALSRTADWEECLWQIWLENFGDVEIQQIRGWVHGGSSPPSGLLPANSALAVSLLSYYDGSLYIISMIFVLTYID